MQYMSIEEFENFFHNNNNDTIIVDLIDSKKFVWLYSIGYLGGWLFSSLYFFLTLVQKNED